MLVAGKLRKNCKKMSLNKNKKRRQGELLAHDGILIQFLKTADWAGC
jgi:hypothetical protein